MFTEHALPAIRPINHIVDGGAVIVRARLGAGPRNGNRGITSDFIRIDAELVTGYELAE